VKLIAHFVGWIWSVVFTCEFDLWIWKDGL